MENRTTEVMLFPDFEALKNEVDKLRAELRILFLERDQLVLQECKNIEMAYMLALGALEYKAFELECQIRRQKRKMELIQAKINRQEKIILIQIDDRLDEEFAKFQKQLNEKIEQMNAALDRSHGKKLTKEENLELKKLYSTIVKALHPDLHPDLTDAQKELFLNAVDAYQHGDLNRLRIIETMVSNNEIVNTKEDGMAALVKEKERLSKLLQTIKDMIMEIKSDFPYTMKELIHNPEQLDARKAELQEKINRLTDVLECYNSKINEMLR